MTTSHLPPAGSTPPTQAKNNKKPLVVGGGVVALALMFAACGVGGATDDSDQKTSATTVTSTATVTSTETTTASATTTTSAAETTDATDTAPRGLIPAPVDDNTTTPRTQQAPQITTEDQGAAPVGGFSSCAQARAAGAAPLYRGSPGYSSDLDRDGHGVACESG